MIMLDFTNPWNFLEELDGWIKFLYELQKNAGFSITELEEMAERSKDNITQPANTSRTSNNQNSMKMEN